jgi:hypothetical protein
MRCDAMVGMQLLLTPTVRIPRRTTYCTYLRHQSVTCVPAYFKIERIINGDAIAASRPWTARLSLRAPRRGPPRPEAACTAEPQGTRTGILSPGTRH